MFGEPGLQRPTQSRLLSRGSEKAGCKSLQDVWCALSRRLGGHEILWASAHLQGDEKIHEHCYRCRSSLKLELRLHRKASPPNHACVVLFGTRRITPSFRLEHSSRRIRKSTSVTRPQSSCRPGMRFIFFT